MRSDFGAHGQYAGKQQTIPPVLALQLEVVANHIGHAATPLCCVELEIDDDARLYPG